MQAGRRATELSGNGQTSPRAVSPQEPPSYPPVQVIRACVSSSSGSEASSINSDLEVYAMGREGAWLLALSLPALLTSLNALLTSCH